MSSSEKKAPQLYLGKSNNKKKRINKKFRTTFFQKFKPNSLSLLYFRTLHSDTFFHVLELH